MTDARPRNCPTCESPQPHLHPAMQFEGEVQPCKDLWHQYQPGARRGWLKEELEEVHNEVAAWPPWKRGETMSRDARREPVEAGMFTREQLDKALALIFHKGTPAMQEVVMEVLAHDGALRQALARQAQEVERLKNIVAYVADCQPDGKKYLDEARALSADYCDEQRQERDTARQDAARLREAALWAMKKVKRLSTRAVDYKRADDFIQHEVALKGA